MQGLEQSGELGFIVAAVIVLLQAVVLAVGKLRDGNGAKSKRGATTPPPAPPPAATGTVGTGSGAHPRIVLFDEMEREVREKVAGVYRRMDASLARLATKEDLEAASKRWGSQCGDLGADIRELRKLMIDHLKEGKP